MTPAYSPGSLMTTYNYLYPPSTQNTRSCSTAVFLQHLNVQKDHSQMYSYYTCDIRILTFFFIFISAFPWNVLNDGASNIYNRSYRWRNWLGTKWMMLDWCLTPLLVHLDVVRIKITVTGRQITVAIHPSLISLRCVLVNYSYFSGPKYSSDWLVPNTYSCIWG